MHSSKAVGKSEIVSFETSIEFICALCTTILYF